MYEPEHTIDAGEDDPYYNSRQAVCAWPMMPVVESVPDVLPFLLHDASTREGIRNAAKRHDVLAIRKHAKPFKWFKFNRARKATAK